MNHEEALKWFLRHRGVETPCSHCNGLGSRTYGSTATWRGGMGGAAMTKDVCDHCWGSGDENDHWTDLRRLKNEQDVRVHQLAGELLAHRCGIGLNILKPALLELCNELDKFERQRRPRPDGFDTVSRCLAGVLRDLIK